MKMWQDKVISIGQWLFVLALLPSILSASKPAWETSLLTAAVLSTFVVCFYTLRMSWSAVSSLAAAVCWWTLLVQVVL